VTRFEGVAYRPRFVTAAYVPASGRDAGRPRPGTVGLLAYLIEQARAIAVELDVDPDRAGIRSLGIYNYRPTAAGTPSVHGEGRAFDLGIAVTRDGHRVMVELLRRIGQNAHRVGLTYAIFSRSQTRAGGWVAYGRRGDRLHDHDDHLHAEQSPAHAAIASATMIATARRVLGDWRRPPTDREDAQMAAYVEIRQRILNDLRMGDDQGRPLKVDGSAGPLTEQAERRFATTVATSAARFHRFAVGLQEALNANHGAKLTVDGSPGPKTLAALSDALSSSGGLSAEQVAGLFRGLLDRTRMRVE
jgi:hypothetical protein